MHEHKRVDGRLANQLRSVHVSFDSFGYAAGSVLFHMGNTKVLCSVTLQNTVPPFLKGKKTGWVTAEYAMLPTSTKMRTQRATSADKQQGRSIEISRLIGRSLRTIIDLDALGERTIMVDCDVLQADGGTRSAAINGACIALHKAQQRWLASGNIDRPFIKDYIAAISVGVTAQGALLDLNFAEDSEVNADFNFVLTRSKEIIEIQGTAEKVALSWHHFDACKELAIAGVDQLFEHMDTVLHHKQTLKSKAPLFSLQNRLQTNL